MDGSIAPIPPQSPQPAHGVRGLTQRQRRGERPFDAELDEEPDEAPDEDEHAEQELDVGKVEPDEAGRNLDLTA